MRWTGQGKFTSVGMTVYYTSSPDKYDRGVAFILNSYSAKTVLSWEPVDENIVTLRMRLQLTHPRDIQNLPEP